MRQPLPLPTDRLMSIQLGATYLLNLNQQLSANTFTKEHVDRFRKLQLTYYGYGNYDSYISTEYLLALQSDIGNSINSHAFHLLDAITNNYNTFGVYNDLLNNITTYNTLLTQVNSFITDLTLLPTIFKNNYHTIDKYLVIESKNKYEFEFLHINHHTFEIATRYFKSTSTDPLLIKYLQKYSPESLL